jgi:uncharacterized protein (DUF924 family)
MVSTAHDHESLLSFWFGPGAPDEKAIARWLALGALHVPEWRPDPEAGADLRDRFGDLLDAMDRGLLEFWLADPRGRLAYILASDALPRTIWRGTERAYRFDRLALDAAASGVAQGVDQHLSLIERAFFFTPLTHAEDADAQQSSLRCYQTLMRQAVESRVDSGLAEVFRIFLRSAERHAGIVARFGRFPHRNTVLRRDTTADEKPYLDDPWGYSFRSLHA